MSHAPSAHQHPIALQLKTIYLPASETFIHRHLTRLRHWHPHVFAEHIELRDRFPLDHISQLPRPPLWQRLPHALLRRITRDETWRAPFRTTPELRATLRTARLIHAHFGEAGIASLALRQRANLPLITSFHGRDVAKPAAHAYGPRLYRQLFREGAAFIVVSTAMRAQLSALGAPAARVHLIRTGVALPDITFAPRIWPADGCVRLLTCGRLVEKKGTRYAIEALARVSTRYPGIHLTVIGDGPLRPALERQAAAAGIAGHISFLGSQPFPRVLAEMHASHLFLLPCVTAVDGDQEGVPVVLMEAQAAGLPILASRHAGIPEVVRDGISGYLAAERDSTHLAALLTELLDHPERWPAQGAAGRAHIVAEFDLDRAAADLEALYDRIAAEQRGT